MTEYPNGSEWRKWDLHIHSTYSCEPKAKLSIQEIFESAVANEIAVINRKIVEILEGTEPAFNVRKSKYQFAGKQEQS